jgi:hypothetical protein
MRPLILLHTLIAAKLGACARCIRLSLFLSIASWMLFAIANLSTAGPFTVTAMLVVALAFSVLFASHLVAFGVRVALAWHTVEPSSVVSHAELAAHRRRFLITSFQVLGLALVPSVIASALHGSPYGGNNCPRPKDCCCSSGCDCLASCCCRGLKTRLKTCDPAYVYCAVQCAGIG